jgi:hypothetical protein
VAQAARAIVVTNRPQAVSFFDARDGLPSPGIVEASFFGAVVLRFDLEPLQGAPRRVPRLRVLRHNALVTPRHRFLPRLQSVIAQPPRREDHAVMPHHAFKHTSAVLQRPVSQITPSKLKNLKGDVDGQRRGLILWLGTPATQTER